LITYSEFYGHLEFNANFVTPINWPKQLQNVKLGSFMATWKHCHPHINKKKLLKLVGLGKEYVIPLRKAICRNTLMYYLKEYGDMNVPQSFVTPFDGSWPEELNGLKLGTVVKSIRQGAYPELKEKLMAHGFVDKSWKDPRVFFRLSLCILIYIIVWKFHIVTWFLPLRRGQST
jgi:hypothetical protein